MKRRVLPAEIIKNRVAIEKQLIMKHPDITKYQLAEYFCAPPAVIANDLRFEDELLNVAVEQLPGNEQFDIWIEIEERNRTLRKALKRKSVEHQLCNFGLWRVPVDYENRPKERTIALCRMGFSFEDAFKYNKNVCLSSSMTTDKTNRLALNTVERSEVKRSLKRAGHFAVDMDPEVKRYIEKKRGYSSYRELYRLIGIASPYKRNRNHESSLVSIQKNMDFNAQKALRMWLDGMTQVDIAERMGKTRMTISTYIRTAQSQMDNNPENEPNNSERRRKNISKKPLHIVQEIVEELEKEAIPITLDEVFVRAKQRELFADLKTSAYIGRLLKEVLAKR